MGNGSTLFPAPANDTSKARIENILELTPVLDIGPVSSTVSFDASRLWPALNAISNRQRDLPGCLHKHSSAMASAGRSRDLWRGSDSAVPCSGPKDGPVKLLASQHALLLRSIWRFVDSHPLPCRASARREEFRDANRAGAAARPADFYNHHKFRPRREWRRTQGRAHHDNAPCSAAPRQWRRWWEWAV